MVIVAGLFQGPAQADPRGRTNPSPTSSPKNKVSALAGKVSDPDRALPTGWRKSKDRAVTSDGDADGFHVLAANAAEAYAWRTVATLVEPGVTTDQWIGQYCLTGSGRRAVVVYAPRQVVNFETRFQKTAFAAVVDLKTGTVHKLGEMVSIAYHNPGCGTGEDAVLTREETGPGAQLTRMFRVDATTGAISGKLTIKGQATSAVPAGRGVDFAQQGAVVHADAGGKTKVLAQTGGTPFHLAAENGGGLAYEVAGGGQVSVRRLRSGREQVIGTATLGSIELQGRGGAIYLTGAGSSSLLRKGSPPANWRAFEVGSDAEVSTHGGIAITSSSTKQEAAARMGVGPAKGPVPIGIAATITGTGRPATFSVMPNAIRPAEGTRMSPALRTLTGTAPATRKGYKAAAVDPSTVTYDPDRTCSIPRNDPKIQTLQPTAAMGEWAADRAVQGTLTITRPTNWNQTGNTASYTPQGMFPPRTGGPRVPAQILLGVLAQESNMWQASSHVIDGQTSNFIQGGFYGNNGDVHTVNWGATDCGYGMAQVTDGMCLQACKKADGTSDTPMAADKQRAIAVDYAANIAAGLQMLQDKWIQLKNVGMTVNDGDPKYLENWWFALWAYNSGYHPQGEDATGMFGLGWTNNPLNTNYKPGRNVFMSDPNDAKTPGLWSYPERVIGWAAYGLTRWDYVAKTYSKAFAPASWPSTAKAAQPDFKTFCALDKNQCDSSKTPACQRSDFKCWWHYPATWINPCSTTCGTERLTYSSTAAEPPRTVPNEDMGTCTSPLPASAVIVDDVPASAPPALGCPDSKNWTHQGSLSFKFGSKVQGTTTVYPSKIDFHQIGAGFGGHFWYAHTQTENTYPDQAVTGTWSPGMSMGKWTRVLVHLPAYGAHTQQAHYTVKLGSTTVAHRYIPTRIEKNAWVSLGVFDFTSTTQQPSVTLSNYTKDGTGVEDVAWDAAAFVPLAAKPKNFVVQLGDSYSSGEGAGPYLPGTDIGYGSNSWNACRRSTNSWIRKTTLRGTSETIGTVADRPSDSTLDYHSVACSGAFTNNIDPEGLGGFAYGQDGQFHEVGQLQSGFLDDNTTLVTLTVGGNDAGFAETIKKCEQIFTCPTLAEMNAKIDAIKGNLVTVLKDIHSKAKYAKIALMGYPNLFEPNASCAGVGPMGQTQGITDLLNSAGNHMTAVQKQAVAEAAAAGSPVSFIDLNLRFDGHRICAGSQEAINGIVGAQEGPGDFPCQINTVCVSRESFHPKSLGTTLYATELTSKQP
ncbi:SGNH/GDSL hydrolase family protein [Actinomadura macrotermitis]|nr:SGNH/GDSL hydrolase family protein [Actinomadura macrotermitis]